MKKSVIFAIGFVFVVVGLAGCDSEPKPVSPSAANSVPATMVASYTSSPIQVDGKLSEPVWKTAKTYPLRRPGKGELLEGGTVQLAWDDQYFYVAIRYQDSDIVAEGKEDQMHHYRLGDLCELFLKPNDQTWYWELYVTPRGKKTGFWFPGRGRLGLPSGFEDYGCGLNVAAQCEGTLNDWRDKDTAWTAEMAVPIADLIARGEAFGPGADWRILVARYNYSRYLPKKELSATPYLSAANFHLLEEYARLKLVK